MFELGAPSCDVCLEPAVPTVTGLSLPGVVTCVDCCVFARGAGLGLADAADFLELCKTVDAVTARPPKVAGTILTPLPVADGPRAPDPESNVVRVFQWPPHCGQWFVRIGSPRDRRSVQFGPLRTPSEALEQFVRHLTARRYEFDGGYVPPSE